MVNKVTLCGVLVSDVKKGGDEKSYAYGKIRVIRYGTYIVTLSFKIWGGSVDWALKKSLKAGMGVQAIGNLSNGDNGTVLLNIDTIQEIPWLTKAFKENPWEKAGKNPAN